MRWNIKEPPEDLVSSLKKEFNTSHIIAKVMANRGLKSLESSKDFFSPSFDQLHDPFMMKNMDISVDRIKISKIKFQFLSLGIMMLMVQLAHHYYILD